MSVLPEDRMDRSEISRTRETINISCASCSTWPRPAGQVLSLLVFSALMVHLVDSGNEPVSSAGGLLGTHPGRIETIACSPDGRWLAVGGFDSSAVIWNLVDRREEASLDGSPEAARGLAFSPESTVLAVACEDGSVRIWKTAGWQLLKVIQAHSGIARSLSFSQDGRSLATVGNDGILALWDTETWEIRKSVDTGDDPLIRVAYSLDGQRITSLGRAKSAKSWDSELRAADVAIDHSSPGGRCLATNLALSPDGRTLAIGFNSQPIELWDRASGRRKATLGPARYVSSLAFSSDGRFLAAGTTGGAVELWDVASGIQQRRVRQNTGIVSCLACTPDGRSLLYGESDGTPRRRDLDPDEVERP